MKDFFKKRKENWLKKILKRAESRTFNIKKNNIFYNGDQLDVNCTIIDTIKKYRELIEFSSINEMEEWFLIKKISMINKTHLLENKEYIFTVGKNLISYISKDGSLSKESFTNIFIVPKGTCNFFGISEGNKIWIK